MGLFRLVLAMCVVPGHGLNLAIPAARPDVAVQTFYIVSGFYMALVLTEKYSDCSTYFTNRLLRLDPAYFAVVPSIATSVSCPIRSISATSWSSASHSIPDGRGRPSPSWSCLWSA